MSMSNEEDALRAAIAALGERTSQRRYGEAMRRRIIGHAVARMAAGHSQATIATSIGIAAPTLSRMLSEARTKAGPKGRARPARPGDRSAFVAVAVAPEIIDERRSCLTVRGPCGTLAEGLSVDDVVLLFTRLASCSV